MTLTVSPALFKAIIQNLTFQGKGGCKFIFRTFDIEFCPNAEYGQKNIELLQDEGMTCYALDEHARMYRMNHWDSFERAWKDGVRMVCAFTLPSEMDSWKEYGMLPLNEIDLRYSA